LSGRQIGSAGGHARERLPGIGLNLALGRKWRQ